MKKHGIHSEIYALSDNYPDKYQLGNVHWSHIILEVGNNKYYDIRGRISLQDVQQEFGTRHLYLLSEKDLVLELRDVGKNFHPHYSWKKYKEWGNRFKVDESSNTIQIKHSDGKDTIRFIDSSGNSDLWKNKRIRYLNSSEALHEHHIMLLDGDKIIGMTGLQVNPYNDKELWIKFVSVDPDYQGKGYGRKLIELIYKYAREKGLKPKSSSFTDMGEKRLKHIHAEFDA